MSSTARFQLPLLSTGQAQKEVSVNEAFQILDALTSGAVEEAPRDDPPASPAIGNCFLVGSSPTGDWSGRAGHLAAFTGGGWRLIAPIEGMTAYVKSEGQSASYRSGSWEIGMLRGASVVIAGQQVVGERGSAISDPSGGPIVDAEARAAIVQVLAALRGHGLIAI